MPAMIRLGAALAAVPVVIAATWTAAQLFYSNTIESQKNLHQQQLEQQTLKREQAEEKLAAQAALTEKASRQAQACPEPGKPVVDSACEVKLAQLQATLQNKPRPPEVEPEKTPAGTAPLPLLATARFDGVTDPACGAKISAVSGHHSEPLSGLQQLLKPTNEDCLWGTAGRKLVVDIRPCAAAADGISSLKVRFSSQKPPQGVVRNRRTNSQYVLFAGASATDFREVFRTTTMSGVDLTKEGDPIKGARLLRLEIDAHPDYQGKLCSIEVR